MRKICRNCRYRDKNKHCYVTDYYGCSHDAVVYEYIAFPLSGVVIDEPAGGPWFGPEFGCIHFEAAQEDHGSDEPAETVSGD